MKILYISHEDDKFGAPKSMMSMIKILQKDFGVVPIVITSKKNDINKQCDELGICNYTCKFSWSMYNKHNNVLISNVKYVARFFIYWKNCLYDIKRISKTVDLREIDLIHTNVSILDVGARLAKKYNKPHVWHLREFGKEDFNFYPFRINFIKYMNAKKSIFIAISKAVAMSWEKKGLNKDSIRVIYNGLDEKKYGCINKLSYNLNTIKIVCCGAISVNKGQLNLIEAIGLIPKNIRNRITVEFIGTSLDDYQGKLERIVKEKKLSDCIHFIGYQKNTHLLLKKYDLGVICSKAEAFGRVTVEYMLSGLCAIVSDTGANTEIIDDNFSGLIYRYNDNRGLADIIEYAVKHPVAIKKISAEARKQALLKFSSRVNALNVHHLYEEALSCFP